jgi:hypothetical protein
MAFALLSFKARRGWVRRGFDTPYTGGDDGPPRASQGISPARLELAVYRVAAERTAPVALTIVGLAPTMP